jgi:Domain of unknown function (DUF397)
MNILVDWRKSSRSGSDQECVEIAVLDDRQAR